MIIISVIVITCILIVLVRKIIKLSKENKELKIKLDYYENHLEANEISMWGMP